MICDVTKVRWLGLVGSLCLLVAGCATIKTEKATADSAPNGIRIYPSTVYLFVDQTKDQTLVKVLPDMENGYDIKPITVLAKQDFQMDISQETANISKIIANQDSTAFIQFLTKAAELGAKAGGVPVAAEVFEGTFGLETGIYVVTREGMLKKMAARP